MLSRNRKKQMDLKNLKLIRNLRLLLKKALLNKHRLRLRRTWWVLCKSVLPKNSRERNHLLPPLEVQTNQLISSSLSNSTIWKSQLHWTMKILKKPRKISKSLKKLWFTGVKSFKDKTRSNTLEPLKRSQARKNLLSKPRTKKNSLKMKNKSSRVKMFLPRHHWNLINSRLPR